MVYRGSQRAVNKGSAMTNDALELMAVAESVRKRAHAPYSGYRVGAAICDSDGHIHRGANTENASFPLGACAEANAIGAMVSAGGTRIARIAIAGGRDTLDNCTPCGGCRQRIAEFADGNTEILVRDEQGTLATYRVADLLPVAFHWPAEN